MLLDLDSQKGAIAITVLLSNSQELLIDYTEDQLSMILTMLLGKKFGCIILKKLVDADRLFETEARSHKQCQEVIRLK